MAGKSVIFPTHGLVIILPLRFQPIQGQDHGGKMIKDGGYSLRSEWVSAVQKGLGRLSRGGTAETAEDAEEEGRANGSATAFGAARHRANLEGPDPVGCRREMGRIFLPHIFLPNLRAGTSHRPPACAEPSAGRLSSAN